MIPTASYGGEYFPKQWYRPLSPTRFSTLLDNTINFVSVSLFSELGQELATLNQGNQTNEGQK